VKHTIKKEDGGCLLECTDDGGLHAPAAGELPDALGAHGVGEAGFGEGILGYLLVIVRVGKLGDPLANAVSVRGIFDINNAEVLGKVVNIFGAEAAHEGGLATAVLPNNTVYTGRVEEKAGFLEEDFASKGEDDALASDEQITVGGANGCSRLGGADGGGGELTNGRAVEMTKEQWKQCLLELGVKRRH
jgi:hypothetical protein